MATLTATAAASTGPVRAVHAGVNSITCTYSGATAISPSATSILMCKIPNGATILDISGLVSSGAATCPFSIGISGGGQEFATAGTVDVILRATKALPYNVSLSDDATPQYVYISAIATPGTVTSEVELSTTIVYTMDR